LTICTPKWGVNLSGNPAYREQERQLRDRLLADWKPEEVNRRVMQSQGERRVMYNAMKTSRDRPNAKRFVRGGGGNEGTVAVKGRARFPYVPPASRPTFTQPPGR
jgi:choline-sulfatase